MTLTAVSAQSVPLVLATARRRTAHPDYTIYAEVKPTQVLVVRAAATGELTDFDLEPGTELHAGEAVARLTGPDYESALNAAQASVRAAGKADVLAHEQQKTAAARYALRIGDRTALDQARTAVVRAEVEVSRARAQLGALRTAGTVRVPVAGTVATVLSADGARVPVGGALFSVEPRGRLWLRGTVYGKTVSVMPVNAQGTFQPVGGGAPVAVRLTRLIPGSFANGVAVGFAPLHRSPKWFSGEAGLVTVQGAPVSEVAIPSSALVLSRGGWWVLTPDGKRFKALRVRPDFAEAGWTWLASGLNAGTQVVASDPYLLFHRAFSQHYASD